MIRIIGAGMAGLLAANMLRRREPVIYERQRSLPNNHHAVLRFRSAVVGEVLGIPFKRVRVVKSTIPWRNPVADALSYSRKTLGVYRSDRSIMPGTEVVERWIAPRDLIPRMAEGVRIFYDKDFDIPSNLAMGWDKVISTIPMPNLMIMTGYQFHPNFSYTRGVNIVARVPNCEAYASVYVPSPDYSFYRASITGDELIVECNHDVPAKFVPKDVENILRDARFLLGLLREDVEDVRLQRQDYGKIAPIDDQERRKFIFWASSVRGIAYQLGRYATWRPGLLLDDVVNDVRIIDRWIGQGEGAGYAMDIHNGRSK